MFGRRPDGRRLDDIDPIVQAMPYIMTKRNDAMNMITQYVDYQPLADYIKKCAKAGRKVSFMDLVVAAYVRTIARYPSMNRFIMNKQVFARNEIKVSLTVLRNADDKENMDEALVKMTFEPTDTIFDVSEKIRVEVNQAVHAQEDNDTADFARVIVRFRPLIIAIVAIAKLLDRYGLLPNSISELSPFHCSMFITNMASIGMPAIFHHTYNFGNTSMFVAMGKFERHPVFSREGTTYKTVMPMGVVTDERICGGVAYANSFLYFKNLLANPEILETPPETVNVDFDFSKWKQKQARKAAKKAAKAAK